MINLSIDPGGVRGLGDPERALLGELLSVFASNASANERKKKYYEGKISLSDVNLGLALPEGMRGLEIGCSWGTKAVDVLAARSMFDGFVDMNGQAVESLDRIVAGNNLLTEYDKATRDELTYGSTFATLSADDRAGAKIRFHSPRTAAALWDGEKGRISCGFAVIDAAQDNSQSGLWSPNLINLYTDDAVWVLYREGSLWYARAFPHRMGRPLMEAMVWAPTSDKPFGRSRIKEPVRRLIDGYVRTIANASIGLEFATAPQKYILGVTDEQYAALINNKFRQYVGSIIASTTNPETGEKPTFGQLSQGGLSPHADMLKMLSAQFAAATGLTVSDVGVVTDANPTSAEAILAQSQTLIATAEQLNASNGNALRSIGLMALAIANSTSLDGLSEEEKAVMAHFKNPAMPSVAATADAAVKIAGARQGFAQTDVFLEMLGFSQADIRRIRAQEQRARGTAILEELGVE